ncbi:MAG: NAD+ synthase [Polyangiales bacterium]
MRIALAQFNPVVGDLEGNVRRMVVMAETAAAAGAELMLWPELCLCGYPPRDWLDRPSFLQACDQALQGLQQQCPPGLCLLVGAPEQAAAGTLYNAAWQVEQGRRTVVARKQLLPTYDVFDEARYFTAAASVAPWHWRGLRLGVTICEDIWTHAPDSPAARYGEQNPVAALSAQGIDVLINLAASPFTLPKRHQRAALLQRVAREAGAPVLYVNQVGGNDELIFDGACAAVDSAGTPVWQAARFAEGWAVLQLQRGTAGDHTVHLSSATMRWDNSACGAAIAPRAGSLADESDAAVGLAALSLGVRDYCRKCGFAGVVLGLSGGIDSALTAAIAVRALGPEAVTGVMLPTRYSSAGSKADALALAEALAIRCLDVPIDSIFASFETGLAPHLPPPTGERDVTWENLQARIRCAALMALSNRARLLLLTTGNKSELAVGYCTLYGDMAGGLAVISDVPKASVYALAHEVNRQAGRCVIPENTLTKEPSAELRPEQKDSDSLPPYPVLDAVVEAYIEEGASIDSICARGYARPVVEQITRWIVQNEYKRRQMPPGLILTRKAFGSGRRYPIAQRYRG